ncbi:hypothetical protein SeMB42_g03197 [Synchytrium endobioticum]|uniref:Uncharacterized protein n=1 Tax=Synchytrium endobioticum TaxID=286115 RepID=A0A507CZ06_9FUNG|nr:hypothetical protein SeLEV6574_g04500 [Synchytrium endobioticum]TPX47799.1 hypothetical protein SeMB42_g03197 [Synchytrium endobioticum]
MAIPLGVASIYRLAAPSNGHTLECSPTFNGVPVAATFLMRQAEPVFNKQFPGLEISSVYVVDGQHFAYSESSLFGLFASSATVRVPIYERLPREEEMRLASAGLRKHPVGEAIISGSCSYGCAKVVITDIKVVKMNGDEVWTWQAGCT